MLYASGKLDIELEEQVYALSEVSVSANIVENVRSTALGVTRLKMKEIKNIPTAFGELDILKVVMALPGSSRWARYPADSMCGEALRTRT